LEEAVMVFLEEMVVLASLKEVVMDCLKVLAVVVVITYLEVMVQVIL
jgi:hypothetical protein